MKALSETRKGVRTARSLLATAGVFGIASPSHAQLAQTMSTKPDYCAIARPWARPSGELLSPKTASATYHALASRWVIDTSSTLREITRFLASNPTLLASLSNAAQSCPKSGCVCPALPNLAQTTQMGQLLNLSASYRSDADGTAGAMAVFLSRHTWVVAHARDSLARFGSKTQRAALMKR